MKIGFSFGRCVRDIVNSRVAYDDVMFIIAATYIEKETQIPDVIDSYLYRRDYLQGLDRDECLDVAHRLWRDQRLLQPRLQSVHLTKVPEWAVWADLAVMPQQENPAIQAAWQQYRMLVDLCGQTQHAPRESWNRL